MANVTDIVDHALIFGGGITAAIAAFFSRRSAKSSREAATASKESQRHFHSKTGKNTADTMEDCAEAIKLLSKEIQVEMKDLSKEIHELLIEQASLAVALGAHLTDDHDPIRKATDQHRRLNRRLDDPKEY